MLLVKHDGHLISFTHEIPLFSRCTVQDGTNTSHASEYVNGAECGSIMTHSRRIQPVKEWQLPIMHFTSHQPKYSDPMIKAQRETSTIISSWLLIQEVAILHQKAVCQPTNKRDETSQLVSQAEFVLAYEDVCYMWRRQHGPSGCYLPCHWLYSVIKIWLLWKCIYELPGIPSSK